MIIINIFLNIFTLNLLLNHIKMLENIVEK